MVIFLTRSEYGSSFIFYHYYNETTYFRRCQMFFSFRLDIIFREDGGVERFRPDMLDSRD